MNSILAILPMALMLSAAPQTDSSAGQVTAVTDSVDDCESVREALKDIPTPEGETFGLEEMVNAVLDFSPDLKEAEQKLIQVQKSIGQVRAALIPSVSVSGTLLLNSKEIKMSMPDFGDLFNNPSNLAGLMTGSYEMKTNDLVMNPKTAAQFSGDITVPLFMAQVYPSIGQMKKTVESTELSLDNAVQQLASGVVSLYGGAIAAQKSLNISKTSVKLAENHLNAARLQHGAGAGSSNQVTQAELSLQQAISQLVTAQYSYNQVMETLSIMSGKQVGAVKDLDWTEAPIPTLDEACKTARDSRLDFKVAEKQIEVAKKTLLASKMAYAPNILGKASMSSSTVKNMAGENTSFTAMLVASWTLFDGLARESKIGANKAAVTEKELNLQTLEANLRKEMSQAIINLRKSQDSSILMKKQLELARKNYEATEYAYNSGAISNLEYNDATDSFNQIQLQEAATDIQTIVARISLYYSMGNLEELLPNVNLKRFSK